MKKTFPYLIALIIFHSLPAGAADNMKAFPPANKGMLRYVLQLPSHNNEQDFKVELLVGKTVDVDGNNRHFFTGKIEQETIEGWGFTRHIVKNLGPMAGTLMAVNPDAPKVKKFVTLGGEPYLIRYNSRLPVVVYVPEGAEVHYRIWSADSTTKAMQEQ